ncbi:MAG: sulfotransferase family 2 domain-containing protein [Pseudomonadota bacterium]|nr:sulfotransferase family 2 domain-containing protein [Pseudomonadota bacterium]
MIISPGRQFVFVHIPKTGGTSLGLALEDRAHRDDILIGDTPKAKKRRGRLRDLTPRGRLWKHSTLADIDGVLGADDLDRMFLFTMVRNPWDRAVSYYHWLKSQTFDHPAITRAQTLSFPAFVRDPVIVDSLRDWPAGRYMQDASGVERDALFIRLEHFDEDSAPLWDHLGFRLSLPHENRSDRDTDYRTYYDDALAAHLGDVCATDILRFKYTFSG